jgi:hypothetical protein
MPGLLLLKTMRKTHFEQISVKEVLKNVKENKKEKQEEERVPEGASDCSRTRAKDH